MGTYTHSVPKGVHPQFDPGPLDGADTARVLAKLDHFLAQARDWEATLLAIRATLSKTLASHMASLGSQLPDAFFKDTQASLEEAIDQLTKGVAFNAGVIPALATIAGKPGLDATQQSIASLRQLREDFLNHQSIDPNRTAVYRLTKGKHVHDGRLLKPGEEVTLTLRQYEAFKDKFEPVAPSVAPVSTAPAKAATTKAATATAKPVRHTTEVLMEKRARRRPH